jgi:hypothetical protein
MPDLVFINGGWQPQQPNTRTQDAGELFEQGKRAAQRDYRLRRGLQLPADGSLGPLELSVTEQALYGGSSGDTLPQRTGAAAHAPSEAEDAALDARIRGEMERHGLSYSAAYDRVRLLDRLDATSRVVATSAPSAAAVTGPQALSAHQAAMELANRLAAAGVPSERALQLAGAGLSEEQALSQASADGSRTGTATGVQRLSASAAQAPSEGVEELARRLQACGLSAELARAEALRCCASGE